MEVIAFMEELGLEPVLWNDEDAICQTLDDHRYAMVTDLDGHEPQSLGEPLYWTLYEEDDFLWSVTLENGQQLADIIRQYGANPDALVQQMAEIREANIAAYEKSLFEGGYRE